MVQNLIARNLFVPALHEDLHAILLIYEERNSLNVYGGEKCMEQKFYRIRKHICNAQCTFSLSSGFPNV